MDGYKLVGFKDGEEIHMSSTGKLFTKKGEEMIPVETKESAAEDRYIKKWREQND